MEICSHAMVHRATFYKYFEDKYQLLDYCMEEMALVFGRDSGNETQFSNYNEFFLSAVRSIFNEFDMHREVYLTILKRNSNDYLTNKVQEILAGKLYNKFEKEKKAGVFIPVPSDILASFYSGACINILYWWIKNENNISVDEVVGYIHDIIEPEHKNT